MIPAVRFPATRRGLPLGRAASAKLTRWQIRALYVLCNFEWCDLVRCTARPSSARGCPAWGGLPLLAHGLPPGCLPTPGCGVSVPAAVEVGDLLQQVSGLSAHM